jgi:hypothetical protein
MQLLLQVLKLFLAHLLLYAIAAAAAVAHLAGPALAASPMRAATIWLLLPKPFVAPEVTVCPP